MISIWDSVAGCVSEIPAKYRENAAFSSLAEARRYNEKLTHRFGLFHYEVVSLKKNNKHIAYGIRQRTGGAWHVLSIKYVKKLCRCVD